MSRDVFCIFEQLDFYGVHTQLALQCAPVFAGIKVSNLLCIAKEQEEELNQILKDTALFQYKLFCNGTKCTYLIYEKDALMAYICSEPVLEFLKDEGYTDVRLEAILEMFQERYIKYMQHRRDFPHELGLLLGYPVEDVRGFIENEGQNFLYSGYWKVYDCKEERIALFEQFDIVTRQVVEMMQRGMDMCEIYHKYSTKCITA